MILKTPFVRQLMLEAIMNFRLSQGYFTGKTILCFSARRTAQKSG
jgi:hypothetical protein